MVNGEMMFYCGITAVAASIVIGIVAFIVFRVRFSSLKHQLDQEYGEQEKKESKPTRRKSGE